MLDYALAILFMSGLASLGFGMAWLFGLRGGRRLALAYPLGLSSVGLVAWGMWLAEIPWIYIWTTAWLVGLLSLSFIVFKLTDRPPDLAMLKIRLPSLNIFTSLLFWLSLGSLILILVWLTTIQPIVWDSLVLYDWRAIKIADGWQVSDFYRQFVQNYEFYTYDFSHPFMSSIWQAFMHKSGIESSSVIHSGLILSILIYAGIIWKSWTTRLIFASLLLVTEPSLTVFTQAYSSLPYFLYWLLIFLVWVDSQIKSSAQKSVLILIFLITLLMNRLSEPFWILIILFWLWEVWKMCPNMRGQKPKWLSVLIRGCLFVIPILAVVWQWQNVQATALSQVEIMDSVSRSSYSLDRYENISVILQTPLWWSQAIWLILFKNPSAPYALLALVMFLIVKTKSGQDKRLFWLGLGWLAMLLIALIMEITTDPENWLLKSRLLWRVTLPIMAWAIVVTTNWSEKRLSWFDQGNDSDE